MRIRTLAAAASAVAVSLTSSASAINFFEGFNQGPNVNAGIPANWVENNNSTINGSTDWFDGNLAVFGPQEGSGYVGANFNNTTGTNTISNWLMTPELSFAAGDVVTFWTRTVTGNPFPDRLQLRFSNAGASTNVGTGPLDVGDFTTLLLDINPTLAVGGYPEVWTSFNAVVPQTVSGRLALRYFVENGGPTGDNSNYIGVDTFSVVTVPEPASLGALALGGLTLLRRRR